MPVLDRIRKFFTAKHPRVGTIVPQYGNQYATWLYNNKRPIFTQLMARAMLSDPRIKFGFYLIKGPILAGSRFYVECDNPMQKEFIIRQITRFWRTSAKLALQSMHYGWYGAEVMYEENPTTGELDFLRLHHLPPLAVTPYLKRGDLTGLGVSPSVVKIEEANREIYLHGPKAFYTVHAREENRWHGQSRLYGPHIPWYELNAPQGFRDCRRLFFFKAAFHAGILHYPVGNQVSPDGTYISNRDIANQALDRMSSGAGMALPKHQDESQSWEYTPPAFVEFGRSAREYGKDLNDEIWEGMGVPPEVARAEGTGAYAGRQVPQDAFYALLQEITQDVMTDFQEQVLSFLCEENGYTAPYEISCFGLLETLSDSPASEGRNEQQKPPPPDRSFQRNSLAGEPEGSTAYLMSANESLRYLTNRNPLILDHPPSKYTYGFNFTT